MWRPVTHASPSFEIVHAIEVPPDPLDAVPGGVEHSAYCGPDGALVLDVFTPVREEYRERWEAEAS